jgi:hypothetical protein
MPAITTFARLDQRAWMAWAVVLAIVAVMIGIYLPGLHGGFVFDDFPNLVDNAAVHVADLRLSSWTAAAFSSEAGTLQRPLSMLSFAINYYFTGFDPAAMKLTNIAVHALNTLLVFGLVRTLFALAAPSVSSQRRQWTAIFVAAAWSLHPINYLAVLYVVQRMESLAHVFVFGGLWLYLLGRQEQLRGKSGRALIGIGLVGGTGLGVLCKESAALLPLYAWLAEACVPALRQSPQRKQVRLLFAAMLWLPLVAGLAWLLPRFMTPSAYAGRGFTLGERLLTEGRVLIEYLQWSVFPKLGDLSLYHDDFVISKGWWSPPSTLFAALALATMAAFAWWLRGRRPISALGLLWFLAAQSMTATIIPLELIFEHRNYFALVGVCLVLADLLLFASAQGPMRRIGAMLAVVFVLGLGATTHLRAWEWRDPMRFAMVEARKRPESPRAMYQYGRMLVIATDYKANSPYVKPAFDTLEQARALPKSGILPHSALLLLASHTHRPLKPEWWTDMQARLRATPVGAQEINAISSLVRCARDGGCNFPISDMVATLDAASSRPHADMYNMYADYLYNVTRERERAVALFRKSIEMRPQIGQYRINLIKVLIAMGRLDEARTEIALLRGMGKLGQYEAEADRLEARMPRMPEPSGTREVQ